jgi:hypothetical protein
VPITRGMKVLAGAAALLSLAACAAPRGSGGSRYPASIHVCETNTATLCADWQWTGERYEAEWAQGSYAQITVASFDRDFILFLRRDPSGTSQGMRASYQGVPRDGEASGVVTWTHDGQTFSGRWTARW